MTTPEVGHTMEQLMKTGEVADVFRVSPSTVSRWAAKGVIPCIRLGGSLRFRRADVEAFVELHTAPVVLPLAPRPPKPVSADREALRQAYPHLDPANRPGRG